MAVGLVAVIAGPLLAQRYGRRVLDDRRVRTLVRERYPARLEPLPGVDADAFFREQHARCFDRHYEASWTSNSLDRKGYIACLEQGYRDRLSRVAVLEAGAMGPHTDPKWVRLEYTVRVREGALPDDLIERDERDCGGAQGWGDGPKGKLERAAPGEYRTSTLLGLHDVTCTVRLLLMYERWPIAKPLIVTTPTPDPARMQAKAAAQELARLAEERTFACIEQAKIRGAAAPVGQVVPEVAAAISRLGAQDARTREQALRDLKKLGSAARPAVPAMVATLSFGYEQTKGYVIEALAAADPEGTESGPILKCLLLQPTPYVRQAAAVALGNVGDPAGATALARELNSEERTTRLSAVRRFREMQQNGKPGLPTLLKHLASDPDPEIRKECANILPWIDPDSEAILNGLREAQSDPDPGVRERATLSIPDLDRVRAHRKMKALEAQ